MISLSLRRYIINLFLDIKNKIFTMMDDKTLFAHTGFLKELASVLTNALSKIEDIYYKYFLLPKLEKIIC
jgi:hypothetical protein